MCNRRWRRGALLFEAEELLLSNAVVVALEDRKNGTEGGRHVYPFTPGVLVFCEGFGWCFPAAAVFVGVLPFFFHVSQGCREDTQGERTQTCSCRCVLWVKCGGFFSCCCAPERRRSVSGREW